MGQWAFQSMVMAAFILSGCAGFLTVEGISRERRIHVGCLEDWVWRNGGPFLLLLADAVGEAPAGN